MDIFSFIKILRTDAIEIKHLNLSNLMPKLSCFHSSPAFDSSLKIIHFTIIDTAMPTTPVSSEVNKRTEKSIAFCNQSLRVTKRSGGSNAFMVITLSSTRVLSA